jgi:hypothetical protein
MNGRQSSVDSRQSAVDGRQSAIDSQSTVDSRQSSVKSGSTKQAPESFRAALRVFDLSIGEMLWSRRTIFMALVVGGPVAIALLFRLLDILGVPAIRVNRVRVGGEAIFGVMIWLLYLKFAVPVLGVFYGTSLMADEIEDKTLTYLFTRPIRRGTVLLGKYLSYLVCTGLVVLPSVMLVYFLVVPLGGGSLGRTFPSLVIDLGLLALGLATYGAVFSFIGAWLKRPLVAGLVFAFGWEQVTMIAPGYLRRATVAYYLQGLAPHAMPDDSPLSALQNLFRDVPSPGVCLAGLFAMTLAFLWLAARTVERREYILSD